MKVLLLLCLSLKLVANVLTVDPQPVWDTECQTCLPSAICPSPCLPVFDNGAVEEVTLDLCNPLYEDGVISTSEGGVLRGNFLRIQARKIVYVKRLDGPEPQFSVYCEGDLLIDYKDRVFVGESLHYDFLTRSGRLTCGKMAAFPWFLGGEEVLLCPDGCVVIHDGYITTSEGGENEIVVHSPEIRVTPDLIVSGVDVVCRVKDVPVLWIPKGGFDLKKTTRSPFSFNFGWNGYLGSYLGLTYHFLTIGAFKGFARADYYIGRGLGLGFESEYNPKCSPTEWYTRNYYAHDISINDPERKNRYRIQGTYYTQFFQDTTSLEAIYDLVSDAQMAADYVTHDFDLNPAQRTELNLRTQGEMWVANLFSRVRVNKFQTVNQELPSLEMNYHPFEIFNSGIILENAFKIGYNAYGFSDDVKDARDFHAGRFEVTPRFYRPIPLGFVRFTPEVRLIGIGYSNSPSGRAVGQAVADIGALTESTLTRFLGPFKHTMIPYVDYHLLTTPRVGVDDHYLFTIADAYDNLNLMRLGMRHLLFFAPSPCLTPLRVDIWTNAFFGAKAIHQVFQKGYLNADWQPHPRLGLGLESSWNFQEHLLDFINMRAEWTVNEWMALGGEYRHRSSFCWRKNDFYDFLLDAIRDEQELLDSPLSDRRDTLLGRIFLHLSPNTAARFEVRNGWNRKLQPHYIEYLLEVESILFQHWRLLFLYEKRTEDNRYSVSIKLDPGPPAARKAKLCRF